MNNSRRRPNYPNFITNADMDKDIYYLPFTNWQINMRDLPKLFIGCKAIKDTYVTKLQLKKLFKIENIDNIDVNLGYAILNIKTSAEGILARQQANAHNLMFKGEDMLLGNAVHHLSFGRHEIIRDYNLTNVVLECRSINERNRVEVNEIAEKHGVVIHLKVIDGTAFIEYRDYSSVVSLLAVENDVMFWGHNMVSKLNEEKLKCVAVKPKYLSLIRGETNVYVVNIKDLSFDKDERKIKEIQKAFAVFGTVKRVSIFKNNSAFVEFDNALSAYSALCKKYIERTKYVTWFIRITQSSLKGVEMKPAENSEVSTYQDNINKSFANDKDRRHKTSLNPVTSIPETDYVSLLNSIIPFSTNNTQQPNKPDQNNAEKEENLLKKENLVNDTEIICTMPTCLEYSKTICKALQSLDLKVGVVNPPENYDINSVVDSMRATGVKAIVFVDMINAKTETLSAKFLNNSLIKMKDIPLNMAVQEFARAFGRNVIEEAKPELQPEKNIHHDEAQSSCELANPPNTSESYSGNKINTRLMKELCGRLARELPISLSENDQLIRYLTEERSRKVSKEYGEYVPNSLKIVPVGPFGDRELKVERENIEDSVEEIIGRFFSEDDHKKSDNEKEADENKNKIASAITTLKDSDGNKDKIASAITTLLNLNKVMNSNR